jgi:hypothetical protein
VAGTSLALDYAQPIPSLQRLLQISQRTQWNVDQIDWTRGVSDSDYLPILGWHGALRSAYLRAQPHGKQEQVARLFVAYEFSQILHGEQGAMMLAGQLINSVDDLDAKLFAATQAKDEARHVGAVRSLIGRMGPIYPIGALLKQTLDALLVCDLWPKQVLGLQLFLEARALLSFREHSLFVTDPVFREVVGNIERDESQHVAFGIQHLKTGIDALTAEQRKELVSYGTWLDRHLWTLIRAEDYRMIFEECDLDYDEYLLTMGPPSKLRPDMTPAQKKSNDLMYQTFERWFFSSLLRVGLSEVAHQAAADRQRPVDDTLLTMDPAAIAEVLPWAKPLADPGG